MARAKSLTADPRYVEFVRRYAFDPLRFAVEVCGQTPTWQQEELANSVAPPGSRTSVSSGHGCFAAGTMMMRADGRPVAVEDIEVGDRLMGPDGASVREVQELKRGREAMYRFTYADGTSHVFNESHILCLVATNSKGRRIAGQKTTVTVREWLTWGEDRKRCHAIYRSGVEDFEGGSVALPIPPYILGVWLGDGTTSVPAVTTGDAEIDVAVSDYAASVGCDVVRAPNSENSRIVRVRRRVGSAQANPMSAALRSLGVFDAKRIPDAYLYASRSDRLELLAGLIDTDGCYDKSGGGFEFVQKDEALARQVAWLARSVGCHATLRQVEKACSNGVRGLYWRVTIGRNVEQVPVRVARKKPPAGARQRNNLHFSIRSYEALGEGDYFGFTLDGDSRFLGHDFTVLHNTGKTNFFGVLGLWHLLCYKNSNTFLTAPKLGTVSRGVWKEFAGHKSAIMRGPHAWIADYFVIESESVYVKGHKLEWWITAKTAPVGRPENLAGAHNNWLLWLCDESSGIPDANFGVIGGSLTDERNRMVMASQPTRPSGYFYDSHHTMSKAEGGVWNALVFNSEESPLVSDAFILEKLIEYGGADSPEYQIKVQGRFPENGDGYLIGRKAIEGRIGMAPTIGLDEPWGHMLTVDVAAGVHRDKTVVTHFRVIGNGDRLDDDPRRADLLDVPIYSNSLDWAESARQTADYANALSNCTVLVDVGGQGVQFAKMLEKFGCPNVVQINWGLKPFKNRLKERFLNLRAQCHVHAVEAIKDGRLALKDIHKKDLLSQMGRLPYHIDELGRWCIMKKEDMKKEGLPSPDYSDAVCMVFIEDAHYIVADGRGNMPGSSRVADVADDMAKKLLAELGLDSPESDAPA